MIEVTLNTLYYLAILAIVIPLFYIGYLARKYADNLCSKKYFTGIKETKHVLRQIQNMLGKESNLELQSILMIEIVGKLLQFTSLIVTVFFITSLVLIKK
jgi:hypothetical protein